MSFVLEGNDCMPSVSGGYLFISIDGEEVATVGVPSPIFADKHRDTVNQNYDDFEDGEGNQYSVFISSSNVGVDWEVKVNTCANDEDVKTRLEIEYQANDY